MGLIQPRLLDQSPVSHGTRVSVLTADQIFGSSGDPAQPNGLFNLKGELDVGCGGETCGSQFSVGPRLITVAALVLLLLIFGDCSIVTGADSKIARQEQGESTWDPLNASELAPNSANGLIPSLIAWAKSQPPGNDAIVSIFVLFLVFCKVRLTPVELQHVHRVAPIW